VAQTQTANGIWINSMAPPDQAADSAGAPAKFDGRSRAMIEGVQPEIDAGRFPVKRVVGEIVRVVRRPVPAADPPDRHDAPQGPQQLGRGRPGRPRLSPWAIGAPRAATRRSTPSSARSRTSAAREAAARSTASSSRWTSPSSAPRPPVGHRAPRVVRAPARRHDPVRREPAEEVPGHLPARLRDRRLARGCGPSSRACSSTGSARASGSSGSTTPTPSRSLLGVVHRRDPREHPDVIFLAEAFTRPR
jgi:hypothetical protein